MPDFPFKTHRGHGKFLRITEVTQEALDRAIAFEPDDMPRIIIGIGNAPAGTLDFRAVVALHGHLQSFIADQFTAMHRSFADRHRRILDRSERLVNEQRLAGQSVDARAAIKRGPGLLAARITQARDALNLTGMSLSKALGMNKTMMGQIESGKWIPTDERLAPIAERLRVSHHELCELAAADRHHLGIKPRKTRAKVPA